MTWIILLMLAVVAIAAFAPDALYALAAAIVTFMDSAPGFPQMFVYIALGAIPVVLLHELGHAIVARMLLGG
ncbi:MAG: hypothetical protein H0W96_00320 [Solirubrobacterales bacterium]|nr:hypothetical protein [Solirubrobacterales bacterium]